MTASIRRLWQYRHFIMGLVRANLSLRYRGSMLGFLWTLVTPLAVLTVFTFIFTVVLSGMPVPKFPVFMMAGYLPWTFTLAALINGTYSLTAHRGFLHLVNVPRESFPLAEVIAQAISFIFTLPILALGMIWFKVLPTPALVIFPLVFTIQFLLTLGLAASVAILYVFFRDLRHLLEVGLTILFYATPIFYPVSLVPDRFRWLYSINPFTGLSTAYQDVLINGHFPAMYDLVYPLVWAGVFLIIGQQLFQRLESDVVELL